MIRLAVFDLDGTLLDTLGDLAAAGNYVLARHGYPTHPTEAYRYFVGDGVYKLIERMTPPGCEKTEAFVTGLLDEFSERYAAHNEELTAPYAGAAELLDQLAARGITLAVLSNKPHRFTQRLCARMFGDRFAVVHGQRAGYPVKPDRALTEEILRLTGFSASETIYIGDSGVDMQTAKNGGLYAVGALWGFRTGEELLENGADQLAKCPMEVMDFFNN